MSRKIGVFMGGLSSEREVSLRSGEAILSTLRQRGHHAVPVYVDRDVDVAIRDLQPDVAFIALHGGMGEDGCVQGLLELLSVPYTGSDVMASALAMHKAMAKEMFRLHNVPTPPHYTRAAFVDGDDARAHGDFGFPCVVKPNSAGSSVGVTICRSEADLAPAVAFARRFDREILVERFIGGMELSVAIVNDRALGAVEIAPLQGGYDYKNKYSLGATETFVPPRLSPERYRGVLAQALRAHLALRCSGLTRVDMIVSETGNEYVLEVNTVPGMTPTSLVPKIAEAAGLPFGELCELVLASAGLSSSRRGEERRISQRAFIGNDRRTSDGPATPPTVSPT